jgi:hypothetical protein
VTWEEAMEISNRLLPGEPGGDELARWQAQRPQPEAPKPLRGLDTAPIDWPAEIAKAASRERALLTEAIGCAIAEYGNELFAEFEGVIDQLRTELNAELANQRNELSARIDSAHTQGNELRAQLEAIIAKKRRAKPNGSRLLLPGPPNGNGDARNPQ